MDADTAVNLANWEARTPIHAASATYDLAGFAADPQRISRVVHFDRRTLGEVSGRSLLHLQCHLGTDTLSWARLGARVTGLDFSPSALEVARGLAASCGLEATFVEAEVYDAPAALGGATFDIVYTGVGAICWLADLDRWAGVVAACLAPGGTFLIRDGHPMLDALDDERDDDALVVTYPYFSTGQAIPFDDPITYADDSVEVPSPATRVWLHGLGDIVTALLDHGLVLDQLTEHRELEWKFFSWMQQDAEGRWVLDDARRDHVPLMFTIRAHKPG